MALTKEKKVEQVEWLHKELEGSSSAIVGSFAKLTVTQDFELRKVVRTAGGRYRVVKNKLASIASKGTEVEGALQGLKGVSSVAYTSGDPVVLAKALSAWVADNAEFTFKLGIIDGKVISIDEIKQLATMPAKEEIYAKLLFLISSPAQRLVTVLNAAGRDMAVVLGQGVEKEKFTSAADPASHAATPPVAEAPIGPVHAVAETVAETSTPAPSQPEAAATLAPVEGAMDSTGASEAKPAEAPASAAEAPAAEVPASEAPASEAEAPVATIVSDASTAEVTASAPSQTEAAATVAPVEGATDATGTEQSPAPESPSE